MLDPARAVPPTAEGGLLTPVFFPAIVGVLLHIMDLSVIHEWRGSEGILGPKRP